MAARRISHLCLPGAIVAGIILVALNTSAMFSMSFNGVAEDEAMTLARKFDWKAIQAAAPK